MSTPPGRCAVSAARREPATDFVIVGGGIAGAAAGYFLSEHGRVILLEAEDVPGRHSTGRSAALFSEYFGNTVVRALTAASRSFLQHPPPDFCDVALLSRRGVLVLAQRGEEQQYSDAVDVGSATSGGIRELSAEEARSRYPSLRADACDRALLRVGVCDIDVAALHHGFLSGIRRNGGQVLVKAPVRSVQRRAGQWIVSTSSGQVQAPVLVNAAGAWAEQVAALAEVESSGLVSRRRTLTLVAPPAGHRTADWPMLTDLCGTFYARPEAGGVLLCPEDDTLAQAGDPRAQDLDVAVAIERYEAVTTEPVRHVISSWAGLRTSATDDSPVIGEAPDTPGFYWFAGLSGYGIQLAPAVGRLLASLVTAAGPSVVDGLSAAVSASRFDLSAVPVPT